MDTAFQIDQVVESTVTAQGLNAGRKYKIVGIEKQSTFFGTFVTYLVRPIAFGVEGDDKMAVANGHLLLKAVR